MRSLAGISGIVLAAVLQGVPASAQGPCPFCRAEYPFGHCDSVAMANPPKGAISIAGTVAKVDAMKCGSDVTIDVRHASQASVPVRIRIEVGPCFIWTGKTGDHINAMVAQVLSNGGTYQAYRCK